MSDCNGTSGTAKTDLMPEIDDKKFKNSKGAAKFANKLKKKLLR